MLATLAVRLGFLFLAIAVPGLVVTIVKRLDRPRAAVRRRAIDPFLYKLFLWRVGLCELAVRPCHHRLRGGGRVRRAVAAAAAAAVDLCGRDRLSRVVVTAHHPSDVVAGAIAGVVGALLVRDWFAARRLGFSSVRTAASGRLPGPSWARIKRVARGLAGQ